MGKRGILSGLLLASAFASVTCAAAVPQPASAIKVLILPAEIKIYHLTAANTLDEQPEASTTASTQANQFTHSYMLTSQVFTYVAMPTLTTDEQTTLKEHLALYKVAAGEAIKVSQMGGPWNAPLAKFDYTVGPGLEFLKKKTGADVALILIGADTESTAGHIAMNFLASLFGGYMAFGRNYMAAGLIDLNTGQILWLDYDTHNARDFTNPSVIKESVNEMLQNYPQGSIHSDNSH